jgi:hypothetical protein
MFARGPRPGVVEVTSVSGRRVDPVPLFDLVTGFPPADALDVTVPMPLSLAVYMTMLESRGRAAELAVLRKLQIEQARETARSIQAVVGDLVGPDVADSARLRITHIVEERVPRVNGLRPHVHAFVGATALSPVDGREIPVDVEQLTSLADAELFPEYRDRLVAATAEHGGLVWGETSWSSLELVGPAWLDERVAQLRDHDLPCRGPWPRRQIVAGRPDVRGA